MFANACSNNNDAKISAPIHVIRNTDKSLSTLSNPSISEEYLINYNVDVDEEIKYYVDSN